MVVATILVVVDSGGDSGRFGSNRDLLSGSDERLTSVRGGILSGQ